jgi:hypothetical protein
MRFDLSELRPGTQPPGGTLAPAWLVVILLASGVPAASQPRPAECPEPEAVEEELWVGARLVKSPRQWRDAEDPLCVAACCAPVSGSSHELQLPGGLQGYRVPFYYLGTFYTKQESRPCSALRSFNLATCKGEMRSDRLPRRYREDFETGRAEALRQRREAEAGFIGSYRAALRAFDDGSYAEAADSLWRAIERWDEDGEQVKEQGRFWNHYLPRYFLARTLFELGCWQPAAATAGCSHLGWCLVNGSRRSEALQSILDEATRRIESGEPEGAGCAEWRGRIGEPSCFECIGCLAR